MDSDLEAEKLVNRIKERFPREAAVTDSWLKERGWEPEEMTFLWVEAFADRTSEAIAMQDWQQVKEHTDFFAAEYCKGAEVVRGLVDAAYAENLMWDLGLETKVSAWQHISAKIQELYSRMWGIPRLADEEGDGAS